MTELNTLINNLANPHGKAFSVKKLAFILNSRVQHLGHHIFNLFSQALLNCILSSSLRIGTHDPILTIFDREPLDQEDEQTPETYYNR
jgi:hypothetical protein